MKLFLTSAGLSTKKLSKFFRKLLIKEPAARTALMIAYAQNKNEQRYVNKSKKELINIGIKNVEVFNLKAKKLKTVLRQPDIIYVCGGNTFAILDRMRKTGTDKYILKRIKNNKSIFLGVSAGSIIAGPNLLTAGWSNKAGENHVKLKDLSGLRLTKISILPHLKKAYQERLAQLTKTANYPVVGLKDNEAIYVDALGRSKRI